MKKKVMKIAVTGASGQIAYSLLFRLASGEVFGKDQPLEINLVDLKDQEDCLKGVVMELQDSAYPLLKKVKIYSDPNQGFEEIDVAVLVGAKPRGPNMERKDLLIENAKIFVDQGTALGKVAKTTVKVFVVGNPCNTNCLIALHHAKDLDPSQFIAMTKLDANRLKAQIVAKEGVLLTDLSDVVIWGNHSSTLVPDTYNMKICDLPIREVIKDHHWLDKELVETVQKRGAEVILARGKSSAGSAANAIVGGLQELYSLHKHFTGGVYATNNPYDIEQDLVFSFPLLSLGNGSFKIREGFDIDFMHDRIKKTEQELIEERDAIRHLLT